MTVFDSLFCQLDPHWPRLESLHVDEVWLSVESFPKFVGKHAKSLRRLTIDRCTMTCSVITGLANIEGLQLKEFIILSFSGGAGSFHIPEARLLAFVNSIGSDFELGQNLYTNANVQVHTHAFAFELDNRAICYAPSNRAFGLRYSTSDLDMLDSNRSCTRDGDESAYEEAGRGEWLAEEGPPGREGELGKYDREHASHVKRLYEAPQWMWGRANDGRGEVHYWKVKPEDG